MEVDIMNKTDKLTAVFGIGLNVAVAAIVIFAVTNLGI